MLLRFGRVRSKEYVHAVRVNPLCVMADISSCHGKVADPRGYVVAHSLVVESAGVVLLDSIKHLSAILWKQVSNPASLMCLSSAMATLLVSQYSSRQGSPAIDQTRTSLQIAPKDQTSSALDGLAYD